MLRRFALIVVQRQSAASASASPSSTGQQVSLALVPIIRCPRLPNKSTHAPSFKVLIGHVSFRFGGGGGGHGVSIGGGLIGTIGGSGTIGGWGLIGGYTMGGGLGM